MKHLRISLFSFLSFILIKLQSPFCNCKLLFVFENLQSLFSIFWNLRWFACLVIVIIAWLTCVFYTYVSHLSLVDFHWVDGSPWIYENWYLTEPDLFDNVDACVFANYKYSGAWNDDNCKHQRRFICKMWLVKGWLRHQLENIDMNIYDET